MTNREDIERKIKVWQAASEAESEARRVLNTAEVLYLNATNELGRAITPDGDTTNWFHFLTDNGGVIKAGTQGGKPNDYVVAWHTKPKEEK